MVKLAGYQSLPSLEYILFVDTKSPTVHFYRREDDGLWLDTVPKGLDEVIEFRKLRISLPLRDICEEVPFTPKLKLMRSPEDARPDSGFRRT